jgi:arylsulfatase A-like enzyme
MMHRLLTHFIVAIAVLGFAFVSPIARAEANRPNVLLITIDTLRPDFLGAYGSKSNASPNLDALASQSVVFERAIAASARTAPSHATMMTSLWIREHSVGWNNGTTQLDGEWTIAEAFKKAGYDTAAFVGNMQLDKRIGLNDGFTVYDDNLRNFEMNRRKILQRLAEGTTKRALIWLARKRDRPWFLWVHYQDPHGPYTPPAPFAPMVKPPTATQQPMPVLSVNKGKDGIPAYQAIRGLRHPEQYLSLYRGEIRYFDHWLGQLIGTVDARNAETVVLVTADHGESFGEEGWWFSHGFRTTPDQVHVPFLLRAQELPPGRSRDLVHHVDVAPTLANLADLPLPAKLRGVALAPIVKAGKSVPDRTVYSDVGSEASAYRGNSFSRAPTLQGSFEPLSFRWSSTRQWEPADPNSQLMEDFER